MGNYLFIVEGNHDISYLSKILTMLEYNLVKNESQLNSVMAKFIPKTFPFIPDSLNIFNYVPVFFEKEGKQVAIINGNGETHLIKRIDDELSKPLETIKNIDEILIFADGDLLDRDDKIKTLIDIDYQKLDIIYANKTDLEGANPFINVVGTNIGVSFYVFPNNKDIGRLEDIILSAIEITHSELIEAAKAMITSVDANYKKSWNSKNSKLEKAQIGLVGNILVPSSSNTASIADDKVDWVSHHTKDKVASINHLYTYLYNKIY